MNLHRLKRKKISGILSDTLQMPFGTLTQGIAQIELLGNSEAVIEGCGGILKFDDQIIKLSLGKMEVQFLGSELTIQTINSERIIIHGKIMSLEYQLT